MCNTIVQDIRQIFKKHRNAFKNHNVRAWSYFEKAFNRAEGEMMNLIKEKYFKSPDINSANIIRYFGQDNTQMYAVVQFNGTSFMDVISVHFFEAEAEKLADRAKKTLDGRFTYIVVSAEGMP